MRTHFANSITRYRCFVAELEGGGGDTSALMLHQAVGYGLTGSWLPGGDCQFRMIGR